MRDEVVRIIYKKDLTEVVPFITFCNVNEEEVGRLVWDVGQLTFIGDMDESADIFFNVCLQNLIDKYIKENR